MNCDVRRVFFGHFKENDQVLVDGNIMIEDSDVMNEMRDAEVHHSSRHIWTCQMI